MKKVFKKKINIKDIAKETGFSMMTVSRAQIYPLKIFFVTQMI